MQCFKDANKIHTAFTKRHIAKLTGMRCGHWQRVFQVDGGNTVDAQLQFGGDVVPRALRLPTSG